MKVIITLLLSLFALTSCVTEKEYSGDELEARSLKAWMKKNHPELVGNYQENGGYFVEVLNWGDTTAAAATSDENDLGNAPIMEQDTCWVYYNFTGYNLDGSVFSTRNEVIARMQATYSDYTHYVPYGNYCGKEEYYAIVEGSYLASRNKITLSEEYVANNADICQGTELMLRKGSKVRLYMTSTIGYTSTGSSAEGSYEGQYTLDANVPMILDMEVMRVVKNPSDVELDMVEQLVKQSNESSEQTQWLQIENTEESDSDTGEEENTDTPATNPEDGESTTDKKKYYEGIYYNNSFKPNMEYAHLQYMRPDVAGVNNPYADTQRYADMAAFDKKLWEILDKKFEDMISSTSEADAKEVTEDNSAIIWYVGRFLDGFIFDTNIDEVRELAFNEQDSASTSISYSVSSDKDEYINAWALAIPKLKYGRWGAVITTSGYAYGTSGVSGSTSSTSSSSTAAYNSLANLYNYYSMMGSSYYNPYSYYNYYNYYGGYTNYYDYEETTSTIETEIPPYAPLVFYIFIEPTE